MESAGPAVQPKIAWEQARGVLALLKALRPTLARVLFHPTDFFQDLRRLENTAIKKRVIRALVFAFLFSYFKFSLELLNIYWLKNFSNDFLPEADRLALVSLSQAVMESPLFLIRPIVTFVIGFFFVAASLKLIIGFQRSLIPLVFIMCYKEAAQVFYCIPFIGGLFAAAWSFILIFLGLKELYQLRAFRSILAGFIMPFSILVFVILSAGSALNKPLVYVFPEMKLQMTRFNDVTAYAAMREVLSAADDYKEKLGFYPVHLGVLEKYLSQGSASGIASPKGVNGYAYRYERKDDEHFILEARPLEGGDSGRFVFYADETGQIRLDGCEGLLIQDSRQMQELALRKEAR